MGREQIRKRRQNQYTILRALHFASSMRRSEIGTQFGIRKSSITSIVSELLGVRIVRELAPGNMRSPIALDHETFHAAVAAVWQDRIRFGRVYCDGQVRNVRDVPLTGGNSPDLVTDALAFGFRDMCRRDVGVPLGLGVAMPGVVDPRTGMCHQAVNLNGWERIPLGEILHERLGNEVYVDNDVRCQLWDCTWFDRLARDTENLLYVGISDGVACAIMTHGSRIVGERCSAGEIGHVQAGHEGRKCPCGRVDCLETYCSLPAIIDSIRKVRPDLALHTASDLAQAADDETVIGVLGHCVQILARSIAAVVAAIDPLYVVLGTGDRKFSERLQPLLQRHLFTELMGLNVGHAEIRIADSVENSTVKGIGGMVIENAFQNAKFKMRRMS